MGLYRVVRGVRDSQNFPRFGWAVPLRLSGCLLRPVGENISGVRGILRGRGVLRLRSANASLAQDDTQEHVSGRSALICELCGAA